jgi:hypothetical protein
VGRPVFLAAVVLLLAGCGGSSLPYDEVTGADCTVDGHLALHWRGNVRAILDCGLVRNDERWVARLDRALAALD